MSYAQLLIPVFGTIALIGLIRLLPTKKAWLPLGSLIALLLVSWPPFDWLISQPLVRRYPVAPLRSDAFEAIVVLSGAVDPPRFERPFPMPNFDTYQRCVYAAWVYRQSPRPVLACGGPPSPDQAAASIAMRDLIQQSGVPRGMIWTEEASRSTHENALYGAKILRERGIRRIALVVEAQSMTRAAACFRKQGIAVVPATSAFRELGSEVSDWLPGWSAIQRNELTLHEVLGLGWYRLRGWI